MKFFRIFILVKKKNYDYNQGKKCFIYRTGT